MSPIPDGPPGLDDGEALQRCLQALDPLRPDFAAAQVYATLALRESVEKLANEIRLAFPTLTWRENAGRDDQPPPRHGA